MVEYWGMKAQSIFRKTTWSLFYVAMLGQLLFAVYIILHYGKSRFTSTDWQSTWNEGVMHGIIKGDTMGNLGFALHVLLAAYIIMTGFLQFLPSVRKRWPNFHRWNGRFYITTSIVAVIAGMLLTYTRPLLIGGSLGMLATNINGLLIITFGIQTIRTAQNKHFAQHRRWALRTYVVMLGVWFFRLGYGLWILLTAGQMYGCNEELTGWYDQFLYYGSYLLPLGILELYFIGRKSENQWLLRGLIALFIILLLCLVGAIFMTYQVFWSQAFQV